MKKNLMKKVFAVTLSVAMACSIIPATNPVTASAASSVKLNTKFKTLKIGAKYKLTLTKNTQNWKVVKATSKAPAIAKVYKTTTKAVKVKGKSEGRTNVVVKLKSGKTTKKLKCKFNVVEKSTPTPTPTPDPGTTDVKTEAEVKNQDELNAALNDSNIKKITIKTDEEAKFETDAKSYADVDLIVDAPKSDVVNNATFKSIEIKAIKGETWTENAKGNSLRLLAALARIIIGPNAEVKTLSIETPKAQLKLTVNGKLGNAVVSAAEIDLNIDGDSKEAVNINVTSGGKGSKVTSAVPVDVKASADMDLNLKEGAEGSKLSLEAADVKVAVDNQTTTPLDITKLDGTKDSVRAKSQGTVSSPASGTTTPVVNPGSSTTTPVNKVDTTLPRPNPDGVIINTGASIQATTGSAAVISGGSLTFGVSGVTHVSGSAVGIECRAVVEGVGGTKDLRQPVGSNGTATFNISSIYGVKPGDEIKIKLYFRVAATSTTNAGDYTSYVERKLQVRGGDFPFASGSFTLETTADHPGTLVEKVDSNSNH